MAILHLTLTWSALTNVIQNATTFLQQIASLQPQLNAAGGTPSALGFFSVVSHLNDFSEVLLTYINVVNRVQSWIGLEIRPVIKHAAHFSRNGCLDASETFINFAYTELSRAAVLPTGLALDEFSPCDYLQHLQQVIFAANVSDTNLTYNSFVVAPESLNNTLQEQFGFVEVLKRTLSLG
jgi:hypothetical protein